MNLMLQEVDMDRLWTMKIDIYTTQSTRKQE